MKIAVFPYGPSFKNKYIDRMVESMRLAFPDVQIYPLPRLKNILSLRKFDYVWLNWFESIPEKSRVKFIIVRIIIILMLILMRVNIISTMHNKKPHEYTNSFWDKLFYYITFRLSHRIIILSSDSKPILEEQFGKTILKKTILIPHPSYDCKPKILRKESRKFRILFFGYLRPYKNIDLIYKLAKQNPSIPFTIVGKAINEEYGEKLQKGAEKIQNITLMNRFISDEELDNLIDTHEIIILPYNIETSLNSGVVIYAICKKINVIVPAIGTVTELDNKDKIFSYTYKSDHDHLFQLNKMIAIAQNEFEKNRKTYDSRIDILYEEVTTAQNPKALSSKIKNLFLT